MGLQISTKNGPKLYKMAKKRPKDAKTIVLCMTFGFLAILDDILIFYENFQNTIYLSLSYLRPYSTKFQV